MNQKQYAVEALSYAIGRLKSINETLIASNNVKQNLETVKEALYTADVLRKEMQRRLLKQKEWKMEAGKEV